MLNPAQTLDISLEALQLIERMGQTHQLSQRSRAIWQHIKQMYEVSFFTSLKRPFSRGDAVEATHKGGYWFSFFDADGGKHVYKITMFQTKMDARLASDSFLERWNVRWTEPLSEDPPTTS